MGPLAAVAGRVLERVSRKRLSTRERLAERLVDKSVPEPNSGCWLWTASVIRKGYGHMWNPTTRSYQAAHRLAYELFIGPIPDDYVVMHRCDVPCCINPDHLIAGTAHANVTRPKRVWPKRSFQQWRP